VDLLSGSISHAVSPVAVRVLPDLRAGAGLGSSPVPQLWVDFVRLPGIRTHRIQLAALPSKSARREPVKRFLTTGLSPTPFRTTAV
jgi:hypothetical protein